MTASRRPWVRVPVLQHAFGFDAPRVEEGNLPTSLVLMTPSSVTRAQALYIARGCAVETVLRDLGSLAVSVYANELSAAGLRPADYADHPEVPEVLRARLLEMIRKKPEIFDNAFIEQLRARG